MKEHDVVYLTETIYLKDESEIPKGTHGVIVHVHNNGEAFEVEFQVKYNTEVVSVPATYLGKFYTIEDLKQAFEGGFETIWEDLEQTISGHKYDSFDEWFKQWRKE